MRNAVGLCFVGLGMALAGVSAQTTTQDWWQDAVFYEVFVRSFQDSDGDGVGDFNGVTSRIDYLTELGVNAVWFMPINPSPSYHGYDVTDYFAVNPDYGTQADFESMLEALHAAGIRVIIDFVGNHSSSQHPRFQNSASAPTATYRDHYTWSETDFGAGWHALNGSHYLGSFWSGMPDWNVTNPEVVAYHYDIVDHWLALGVDGFRYDAVKHLVDNMAAGFTSNHPGTFEYLLNFYDHYKSVSAEAFCVGEAWDQTAVIAQYGPPHLDGCFEFGLANGILSAVNGGSTAAFTTAMNAVLAQHEPGAYAPFLTNHDQDRAFNQLGQDVAKMKLAASVYLSLPGFPFVYYGEEIGMTGTGADPNKRTPMQWDDTPGAGFTSGEPWMSVNSDLAGTNVADQDADPQSLLEHYRELIALRQAEPALRRGNFTWGTASDPNVSAFLRTHQDTAVLCLHHFGTTDAPVVEVALGALCPVDYQVLDLADGTDLGVVTAGDLANWAVPDGVQARESRWLKFIPLEPVACVGPVDVTFAVDLGGAEPHPAGVHMAGNFQGWDPAGTPMTWAYGNVWTHNVTLELGETIEYKFINGNAWGGLEEVSLVDCGVGGTLNRMFTLSSPLDEPGIPCFDQCTACPVACPADLTGDGWVAVDDILQYLSAFGCTGACPEDVNGDALVGVSDLLVLLSVFGEPCPN